MFNTPDKSCERTKIFSLLKLNRITIRWPLPNRVGAFAGPFSYRCKIRRWCRCASLFVTTVNISSSPPCRTTTVSTILIPRKSESKSLNLLGPITSVCNVDRLYVSGLLFVIFIGNAIIKNAWYFLVTARKGPGSPAVPGRGERYHQARWRASLASAESSTRLAPTGDTLRRLRTLMCAPDGPPRLAVADRRAQLRGTPRSRPVLLCSSSSGGELPSSQPGRSAGADLLWEKSTVAGCWWLICSERKLLLTGGW
jgi:hypothetical protein